MIERRGKDPQVKDSHMKIVAEFINATTSPKSARIDSQQIIQQEARKSSSLADSKWKSTLISEFQPPK